jgi:ABC-type branched-subunit amino acid transport system ATPase component
VLVSSNVTMQFGSKPLFENISVKFGGGNRYGLIGANGSGKSTFMKILGGDLEPTLGNVSLDPNERIGKLRQDQFAFEEFTVLDTVIMGHKELWEVKQERDRIYALPEMSEEDGYKVADLEVKYGEMDGYSAEARAGELLLGVGIPVEQHYGPMSEVAPGWKLRVLLAQALEFKQELWGLVIVAAGFALLARRVVLSVDWTLLLVFMAMFIDVHLLTQLPALQGVLGNVSHLSEPGLWLTAIGLSQVISNVPSTILLLNYVPPSLLLVWAVNVGGFGLLPGSLANLIALRMANDRRIWWRFHLYSIPMLLWAALVGYVLLVILPAN